MNQTGYWSGWRSELKLSLAEVFKQLGASKETRQRILGLSPLEIHVAKQRALMTPAFKRRILDKYDWTSAKSGIRNYLNKELGKPYIHVDHIVPVTLWGYTIESNMQLLTEFENKSKLNRNTIDYRAEAIMVKPNWLLRFVRAMFRA